MAIMSITAAGLRLGIMLVAAGAAAVPAVQPAPVISACDKPFIFGFGSWEQAQTAFAALPDGLHIRAGDCKGGGGLVAGGALSLVGYEDWVPSLKLSVSGQNKAGALNIDFGVAPMMNENTFNSATLAAAYYWGFLAARAEHAPRQD